MPGIICPRFSWFQACLLRPCLCKCSLLIPSYVILFLLYVNAMWGIFSITHPPSTSSYATSTSGISTPSYPHEQGGNKTATTTTMDADHATGGDKSLDAMGRDGCGFDSLPACARTLLHPNGPFVGGALRFAQRIGPFLIAFAGGALANFRQIWTLLLAF